MLGRLVGAIAGAITSFVMALLSYALFLVVTGQISVLGRFYLYSWLAAATGLLFSATLCAMRPLKLLSPLSLGIFIGTLVVPLLKVFNTTPDFDRFVRWFVFIAHLPLSAACGVLVAMHIYRNIRALDNA
jgi:hypothetical protein